MRNPQIESWLIESEVLQRWAPGELLFREGDAPYGVYVLHSGKVDLLFATRNGNVKPFRVAQRGQILGLSAVVMRRPHDCSARARTACEAGFIASDTFLRALNEAPATWFSVLSQLSCEVNAVYNEMRVASSRRTTHRSLAPRRSSPGTTGRDAR